MTSFGPIADVKKVMDTGHFEVLAQTGVLVGSKLESRPELGAAPIMATLIAGRVTDPIAKQALSYWLDISQVGTWLALPPATPKPVVTAYHDAMKQVFSDPAFSAQMNKLLPDALMMDGESVQTLLTDLANTSPEALEYMRRLQRKQGISVSN
jgi:hypothetical protein